MTPEAAYNLAAKSTDPLKGLTGKDKEMVQAAMNALEEERRLKASPAASKPDTGDGGGGGFTI